MKSFLLVAVLVMLVCFLPAYAMQTPPSQQKVEVQGELKLGETQKRTLAPEANHVWNLTLEADQYIVVEVEQKSIDVIVRIIDPQGTHRHEFNDPIAWDIEKAAWITHKFGKWKVEVLSTSAKLAGAYEIKFKILHKAIERDWQMVKADSIHNLALTYYSKNKFAEAEPLYKQSLTIKEKIWGQNHPEVAAILDNLAKLYALSGKYTEAEPLFKKALTIRENLLGPIHRDVATSLHNLARLYDEKGNYSDAEALHKRSLAIREKILGLNHPDIAMSLNSLAGVYIEQGRYAEAEPLYKRSLTVNERALGATHFYVTANLNNLAMLYSDQGKYAVAESLAKRSLIIRENILGPDHPEVATALNNFALLIEEQGKYAEAELLYRRALEIREKTLGRDHPRVATVLNNLAVLCQNQKKHKDAAKFFKRSLTIRENALGREHPSVAQSLGNLAASYLSQGNYTTAEALFQKSLAIDEKKLGPNHLDVAAILNNLATLHDFQGNYAVAESLYKRSLSIREIALGTNHPDVAKSLISLAGTMFREGVEKRESALTLIMRAIYILDGSIGAVERRIDAYALRSQLRKQNEDWNGAIADLAEALRSAEKLRPQIGGGEEARASFSESYADHFNRMVAWQLEAGKIEQALDYAERNRARVFLDQLAVVQIDLLNSILEKDKRLSLEKRQTNAKAGMAEYQQRINRLPARKDLSNEEKNKQIAALNDSLKLTERDYEQIWEEIKLASPLWQNVVTSGGQPVLLAAIQNELVRQNSLMLLYQIGKEGSHLFVIPSGEQKAEVVALQVAANDTSILQVKAGPLKSTDLQKILADSSAGLLQYLKMNPDLVKSGQETSAPTKLQALWNVLMPSSVWTKVKACAEVIIIPDGVLHQLPFEALVVQSGKTPVETRYWLDEGPVIRYAPSATILHSLEKRQIEKSSAQPDILSLSDPIFDLEAVGKEMQKLIASRGATSQDSTTTQSAGLMETLLAETRSQERAFAGPLPRLLGTDTETNYMRQYFGPKSVKALQQLQADEPNLRANIQGKRYIHLATHGLVELQQSSLSNALALTPPPKDTINAENDGFLKLYEIYELKLNTCELAVLSACETHFGRLFEGEGVFALSRGFLAAGAARVVASHWQVQDLSTAELVGAFFRSVANAEKSGKPVDYALALRDAKLKLRRDKNRRQWAAPYFWAPFIITGKN